MLLLLMAHPDPEVRWRAEFALGRAGAGAVPALVEALKDKDVEQRRHAAYVLGPLGKKARAAAPALVRALQDADAGVRVWASKSLGDVDPESPESVAAFAAALGDADADVRRVTITNLIKIGPKGKAAIPALVEVLKDPDPGIRWRACIALRQNGPDAAPAAPALAALLKDPDLDVRSRAAQALVRIGPAAAPAVRPALEDPDEHVRGVAARILQRFEETARPAAVAGPAVQEPPGAAAERARWYNEAKFGMFIHWGLYAVPARARPGTLSEWIMNNEKIPVPEYEKFAGGFTAERFDAREWARIARDAGMRYLVLTAKHHDGFCLWDTKLTGFNAARFAPARRDVVRELSAACEALGLKFCAYYSMLDWHHPDYAADFPRYVDWMLRHLEELLTRCPVWGMWFDGEWGHMKDEWRGNEIIAMIRRIRPLAFINDRLGRETRGTIAGVDFYTKEQEIPPAALRLQNRPVAWETCQTFGYSWGYNESPDPLKSGERVIEQLVDVASKGGNFLLNVGPRPDGTIPEPLVERMKVIGRWMRKNGEAIYGTERSPFGGPIPAGRVTAKGNTLYVFLEDLPREGIALPRLATRVVRARVIEDGAPLAVARKDGTWIVAAPAKLLDPTFTVVAVELDGPPEVR